MKQIIAVIRYLYVKVFSKPIPRSLDVKLLKPTLLPKVLSTTAISKILSATPNLKHKTILFLIYSAGLRLGELLEILREYYKIYKPKDSIFEGQN